MLLVGLVDGCILAVLGGASAVVTVTRLLAEALSVLARAGKPATGLNTWSSRPLLDVTYVVMFVLQSNTAIGASKLSSRVYKLLHLTPWSLQDG